MMHFGLDKIFVITKPQQPTGKADLLFSLRQDSSHEAPVDLFLPPIVAHHCVALLPVVASTTMEPTMWGCR